MSQSEESVSPQEFFKELVREYRELPAHELGQHIEAAVTARNENREAESKGKKS